MSPDREHIEEFLFNAFEDALDYYGEAASEEGDNQLYYRRFAEIAAWLLDDARWTRLPNGLDL